jgi:hypothetical protein
LKKFNFGDSIIKWIEICYANISRLSCVINNGWTSDYIKLGRGVPQGDPLSPYLFALVAEIFACSIRQDKKLRELNWGIENRNYADDTYSGTLANERSGRFCSFWGNVVRVSGCTPVSKR